MTTTTKGSQTKEKLMEAATALMIERGYDATSVDDICDQAKVNRGSFFYYFKSKEELAKELIKFFSGRMEQGFTAGCCNSEDPLERVYSLIDCGIEMTRSPDMKGCLVGTLTQEISKSHPNLRKLCCESLNTVADMIKKDLMEAKKKYAPRKAIDVESLGQYFVASGQGAMILMKASQDRSVIAKMLTHYKQYLKSVFGR